MATMDRRNFITGLGATVTLAPGLTLRVSAATNQIRGELMLADLDTIKSAPAAAPKA